MNIKELAEQAGIDEYEFGYMDITKAELEKFAELVAAHEREECAKVCELGYVKNLGIYQNLPSHYAHNHACKVFAESIRARSKT